GDVAVTCDNDREGLAGVTCDLSGSSVVRDRAVDAGGERAGQGRDVRARGDAKHARGGGSAGGVGGCYAGGRGSGTGDGRGGGGWHRIDVVHEPALPAEQSIVLETRQSAPDPRLDALRDRHGRTLVRLCGPARSASRRCAAAAPLRKGFREA